MKPTCIVSCPIDTFSGYGHRSRDFVRSLIKAKKEEWDISILPQKWGNTPWGYLNNEDPLKSHFLESGEVAKPDVWIQITIPSEFQPLGKYNIGVTAGIESTVPPPNFVQGMNNMDLNLVSSKFTKDTFSQVQFTQNDDKGNPVGIIKLEKPIEVLFEGLDLDTYFKKPEKSNLLNNIEENFCFLFTGQWLPGDHGEDRKSIGTLIETFLNTFNKKGPKPALLLKTNLFNGYSILDRENVLKRINEVRDKFKDKTNLPNIYILHGEFTNEELNKINNDPKVKAFVSFTKGEGFGRPLLEQAITGKPVITTNWSGHVDFIRPEYNLLLNGELKPIHESAVNKWLIKEANWFNIDTEIASAALKDIYKNYKKYIERSRKQTQYLKDNFSMSNMDKVLKNQLKEVKPVSNVTLKLPQLKKAEPTTPTLPKLTLPKLEKANG